MALELVLPNESTAMPVGELVKLTGLAEDLGYSTAWLPDHVLPPSDYGLTFGGVYEPLITIAHLTAGAATLRFGTSVLVAPLRDPFVLAKQVATLHQISEGRLVLGIGVGWNETEFDAVGADFQQRGAITDDQLELLKHLFSGGLAPYQGRRFSYDQGVFAPIPENQVPIMIGGNSKAALRRAARYADVWQGLPADPESFAHQARYLAELSGDREVAAALRIQWDGVAQVEQVAELIADYRRAGAAHVAVHFGEWEGTSQRMAALAKAVG